MADLNYFVNRMIYWCDEADLGYDQWNRWDVREGGETDCSALVITALQEAGFDTGSATYTGNMSSNLTARGWKRVANNGRPQKGDILLNDVNHVGVWTGYGVAQASGDEKGGITGGRAGDQTGYETFVTNGYYNYPWDCYLRYEGTGNDDDSVHYAVSTDENGREWCDDMYNTWDSGGSSDDFAGNGKPIYFFTVDTDMYQVRTAESGWLDTVSGFSKSDLVNHAAGNEHEAITAVRVYDSDIAYQVYTAEDGWLDVMHGVYDTGGSGDDFAGLDDHKILKIRMWRV